MGKLNSSGGIGLAQQLQIRVGGVFFYISIFCSSNNM